jgi:hypothetical protein
VNTLWKNVFSNSDLVLSSVFIPPSSSKIHGMLSLALVFDFIKNIPESKSMSRKYDTPWINEESKIALVEKRKLWKKYRYNKNPQNKTKYDEASNFKFQFILFNCALIFS